MPCVEISNGASSERRYNAANLLPNTTPRTVQCWVRRPTLPATPPGTYWGFAFLGESGQEDLGDRHLKLFEDGDRRIGITTRGIDHSAVNGTDDPDAWYLVVLDDDGTDHRVRVFADDAELTKIGEVTRSSTRTCRQFSIHAQVSASTLIPTRFTNLKVFAGAALSDADCRAQAVTRAAVAHAATLWDRFPSTDHTTWNVGADNAEELTLADSGGSIATVEDDEPAALAAAPPAELRQTAHRWRADDDTEAAATWLAAENANVTRETGQATRLRILSDATGDRPSEGLLLHYEDPRLGWRVVKAT